MDQVPAPFLHSMVTLQRGQNAVQYVQQMGSLIYTSRNEIAKKAIQGEFDYLMWFDSDMVFPSDTMLRMLKVMEENNIDFLTGMYFRRVTPFTPTLFSKLEMLEDGSGCDFENIVEIPEGLTEVAGCGFGCVLINVDVLFDVLAKYGTLFNPMAGMGEDLAFCWRARSLGYKIICDPSIELGHVGYTIVNRNFYRSYNAQKGDADEIHS